MNEKKIKSVYISYLPLNKVKYLVAGGHLLKETLTVNDLLSQMTLFYLGMGRNMALFFTKSTSKQTV